MSSENRMTIKTILIYGLLLSMSLVACTSVEKKMRHTQTKLTVQQQLKDIDYVEKNLHKMHPDLYWYIDQEELNNKFNTLKKNTVIARTPNEFHLQLSPVLAAVKQGHMQLLPLPTNLLPKKQQTKEFKKSKGPLSQLEFLWSKDTLYLSENKTHDSLLIKGAIVKSINGITPQDLYRKYRPTFTSDGYNTTFIDKRFSMTIARYYALELGIQDTLKLQLVCDDSTYVHKVVRKYNNGSLASIKDSLSMGSKEINKKQQQELHREERERKRLFGYTSETKQFSKSLNFPVATDSTLAVLKIRDFTKGIPHEVYKDIFEQIEQKKVQHLVLDLRGNLGGRIQEMVELTTYLSQEESFTPLQNTKITSAFRLPFYVAKGKSVIHYTLLSPFYLIQSIFLWTRTYKDDQGNSYYRMKGSTPQVPNAKAYTGPLYVLIDGATFSASSLLTAQLKMRSQVVFVGEETGGAFNGTVAGRLPVLTLPESQLKWILGTMSIKPTTQSSKDGHGVYPDVPITVSANDILQENDPVMNWVIEHYNKD